MSTTYTILQANSLFLTSIIMDAKHEKISGFPVWKFHAAVGRNVNKEKMSQLFLTIFYDFWPILVMLEIKLMRVCELYFDFI